MRRMSCGGCRWWVIFAALSFVFVMGCGGDSKSPKPEANNAPATCGNGALDDGEVCDAAFLGDETCQSQAASQGTLACWADCLGFDLGGCEAPETCGDASVQAPEVCDAEDLNAKTCADLGFDSGTLACASNCLQFDTTQCARETGANNSCVPKTCDDVGALCGSVDDGCGGLLACGECSDGLTCGGAGTANVCGATCRSGCPDGYTCDELGVCRGGDSFSLVLDVPISTVTVSTTVNGESIRPNGDCGTHYSIADVIFTNVETQQARTKELPCSGSVDLHLPHGTYQVSVKGKYSSNNNSWIFHEVAWRLAIP